QLVEVAHEHGAVSGVDGDVAVEHGAPRLHYYILGDAGEEGPQEELVAVVVLEVLLLVQGAIVQRVDARGHDARVTFKLEAAIIDHRGLIGFFAVSYSRLWWWSRGLVRLETGKDPTVDAGQGTDGQVGGVHGLERRQEEVVLESLHERLENLIVLG